MAQARVTHCRRTVGGVTPHAIVPARYLAGTLLRPTALYFKREQVELFLNDFLATEDTEVTEKTI